jgi:hypothetical protein
MTYATDLDSAERSFVFALEEKPLSIAELRKKGCFLKNTRIFSCLCKLESMGFLIYEEGRMKYGILGVAEGSLAEKIYRRTK